MVIWITNLYKYIRQNLRNDPLHSTQAKTCNYAPTNLKVHTLHPLKYQVKSLHIYSKLCSFLLLHTDCCLNAKHGTSHPNWNAQNVTLPHPSFLKSNVLIGTHDTMFSLNTIATPTKIGVDSPWQLCTIPFLELFRNCVRKMTSSQQLLPNIARDKQGQVIVLSSMCLHDHAFGMWHIWPAASDIL